jgi:tetratricopeptide (TPR) repeat protein
MTKRHMKYNPSFLSEAQLIENFVVRHTDLDLIIRIIKENNTGSNQHVLVIGPRGSGKTTLVHRIAAEIKQNTDLNERWYPLIFSEESYEVVSVGEFWLEALFHLSEQMKDENLKNTYLELKSETDDHRLAERALGQLLDFADNKKKRILLCVENLNMLLGDLVNTDEAWKIRHTLMNEPRLMLLATATNRFEQIENSSQAMFEMFKLQELKSLNDDECNRIWELITGEKLPGERIKPIRILTGGNPRLLTIIAKFGAHRSFRQLLDDLVDLIDDHTDYFKSHMDNLPSIERKVYLALAGLWDASTARDIARAARLDINKTSSLLTRLIGRGAVIVEEQRKKIKWYAVSERMYNIYYLMRRRGKPSDRVKATVKFMVSMYDPESTAKLIADEACSLSPEFCLDHYLAYEETIKETPSPQLLEKILSTTPKSFFDSPYLSETLKNIVANKKMSNNEKVNDREDVDLKEAKKLIQQGTTYINKENLGQVVNIYDEVIKKFSDKEDMELREYVAMAMYNKAIALGKLNRSEAEIVAYDKFIEHFTDTKEADISEHVAMAMNNKAVTFEKLNRFEEAIIVYNEVIARFADAEEKGIRVQVTMAMNNKAIIFEKLNRSEEAIIVYNEVIARFADAEEKEIHEQIAITMLNKAVILSKLNRFNEAIVGYDEVIKRFEGSKNTGILEKVVVAMNYKAITLGDHNRSEEEIAGYDEVIKRFADVKEKEIRVQVAMAMNNKAVILGKLNRPEEEIAIYNEVVKQFTGMEDTEILVKVVVAMNNKAVILGKLNRPEEKIAVYDEVIKRFIDAEEKEIREKVAKTMLNKAITLGQLNHPKEAIAVYDEVIKRFIDAEEKEIREKVAMAFSLKGTMFALLNKYEEAERSLRKAIELIPDFTNAIIELINVLLKRPEMLDIALQTVGEVIDRKPNDSELLNGVAWVIYKYDNLSLFPKAENWSRQAVTLSPDNANVHHTLACILSAIGKGKEALPSARRYIQDSVLVENTIEDAIELFVELATSGYAKEALDILVNSPVQQHLEPLVVGLKYFIGEDVKTAAEIQEVANDIVKRIEERLKRRGHNRA